MEDRDIWTILREVKTIALVGASDKPDRPSYVVMEFLLSQGYDVIPVSPKLAGQMLLGQPVFANLKDIQRPVDMVDVFRHSDAVYEIAQEAIAIKASVLWMQIGVINHEAEALAQSAGLKVVMNLCPKIEIKRLGMNQS
ncbi:CoA-binding protein [Pragia fontium]|uniref:CoA-binding domain-containing protein n=1 Tax=Pragia fontium DSM 5563 = ATCC 49100 TaxID=1122977 RepID=A0AAJ4WBX0_9GAMM|nr:CoA-binding protein [Pragia fontium]SFD11610.1 hypothetical protein SAMN02745723_10849 [Pragia fontium DSM 5563 = ATCC 49100]